MSGADGCSWRWIQNWINVRAAKGVSTPLSSLLIPLDGHLICNRDVPAHMFGDIEVL